MPRKTTVTETIEEPLNDPFDIGETVQIEGEPEDIESEEALDGLMSEFTGADGISVNVYRRGAGRDISFLFKTTPDEMTGGDIMERCRDSYGTGDYRLHIRKKGRLVQNRPFSVEAPIKREEPAASESKSDILPLVMAQMQQQQQMFMAAMQSMATAFAGNRQPAADPTAMLTGVMQSVATLKGMTDTKPQKDPVEMLVQGITLAKELNGTEGPTGTNDILMEGLKAFAPTIAAATAQGLSQSQQQARQHQQARQTAQVATQQHPQLNPPQPDPTQNPTPEEDEAAMLERLAMQNQLTFLINQAKNGKDPALYAELLVDQVGVYMAMTFVARDDAMEQLIAINPDVALYKSWFEALKEEIIALTAPEPTDDTNEDVNTTTHQEEGPSAVPDTDSNSEPASDT